MKIFGIVGGTDAGRAELTERLVAAIAGRGFSVSTVRHLSPEAAMGQPARPVQGYRSAGASEVVLASADRFMLLRDHLGAEPDLHALLARPAACAIHSTPGHGVHRPRALAAFAHPIPDPARPAAHRPLHGCAAPAACAHRRPRHRAGAAHRHWSTWLGAFVFKVR